MRHEAMRTVMHRTLRVWCVFLGVLALHIGAGCRSAPSDNSLQTSEFEQVFGDLSESAPKQGDTRGWTIVLSTFSGPDAGERAERTAQALGGATWMRDLRVRMQEEGAVLSYGRYDAPGDADARRDLQRVRQTEVNGELPFQAAFLSPPERVEDAGGHPQLALSNVREEYGPNALYTLQVAVYESPDRDEAKRAAEQAALQLRREGELAFYHHGPHRSMVTIGVFRPRDYDPMTGEMSQELLDLKGRHPHNLYNGMGLREHGPRGERLQPSGLVLIPE